MCDFYIDEPVVVSFAIGELGWSLQRWFSYLRYLKHDVYKDRKFILFTDLALHIFVDDFITYTIGLPDWFYKLGLDRDCYEAVNKDSPPGALTDSKVYNKLINHFRTHYNQEKAIEVWPPRGCNVWVDETIQIFCKIKTKQPLFVADKYIVVVFPRKRTRASNRNVPEFVWRDLVDKLKHRCLVVLAGTPEGAGLEDYRGQNVVNLIGYNGDDKTDLIIRYLNSAICSVSSQSGGTHISLLSGCPSYIIGHERERHAEKENRLSVPTSFRYVFDYRAIDADVIIDDIENFVKIMFQDGVVQIPFGIPRPSLHSLMGRKGLVGAEIGVFDGINARNIMNFLDVKKLYLIDPYDNSNKISGLTLSDEETKDIINDCKNNIKQWKDKIKHVYKNSIDAVNDIKDDLDFVYLDGDHSYETVKFELENYYKLVKEGGLIAGHDYENEGVSRAVDEFFGKKGIEVYIDKDPYDHRTHDWWCVKPIKNHKVINEDQKILRDLINENTSSF